MLRTMGLWPLPHPLHDGEKKLLGAQQACPHLSLPARQALGYPELPRTLCTTGGTEPGALPVFGAASVCVAPSARR